MSQKTTDTDGLTSDPNMGSMTLFLTYPENEDSRKSVTVYASVHIHNAQTKVHSGAAISLCMLTYS